MKAEELRIGNWVKMYDEPKQVESIELPTWVNGFGIHHIQPIPLTPEILEKAATYTKSYSYYFEVPEVKRTVAVTWYDNEQKRVFLNDNYIGILHLQYVHELQNLIHALTSSELPLNL